MLQKKKRKSKELRISKVKFLLYKITVRKFKNFCGNKILREIKFVESRMSKKAILTISETDFYPILTFSKVEN